MKIQNKRKSTLIIALCWLVYTCSYIGKLSYSANINAIGTALEVSYSEAGAVTTFFFFAYGIGQVVNGLLCKKYNLKYVIFGALAVACTMNVAIVLTKSVALMKYFWLINGAAMSFLWPSLIRLLSETLTAEEKGKAVLVMGTTVATGTFLVYGISAIFVAFLSYHATFILAAAIMAAIAIIWLFSYNRLVEPQRTELQHLSDISADERGNDRTVKARNRGLLLFFPTVAIFAVTNNFTKDGLTSWTPDILDSIFDTPDWMSIMLTLLLPLLAIGGAAVAIFLQKRTKSFIGSCTVFFGVSALLILAVIVLIFNVSGIVLTVACFAIVSCLMAGVNNVITGMIPLQLKGKVNSGRLAGVLNGFCYLGSTLSSYGLGAIADATDWITVFYVLLASCTAVSALGLIYLAVEWLMKRKREAKGKI